MERTLALGKGDGLLLGVERLASALHVVRAARQHQPHAHAENAETHELAQPMRLFSQRPPPGRMSQSRRQPLPFEPPLCIVFRVGW
jgi:hypothetical protein